MPGAGVSNLPGLCPGQWMSLPGPAIPCRGPVPWQLPAGLVPISSTSLWQGLQRFLFGLNTTFPTVPVHKVLHLLGGLLRHNCPLWIPLDCCCISDAQWLKTAKPDFEVYQCWSIHLGPKRQDFHFSIFNAYLNAFWLCHKYLLKRCWLQIFLWSIKSLWESLPF